MENTDITKENPVYLYRIVQTANKSLGLGSYKEFICVKAWLDMNAVMGDDCYIFSYYYNDRLYHSRVPNTPNTIVCDSKNTFAFWTYEKNDELAMSLCKDWLKNQIAGRQLDLKNRAYRMLYDKEFLYSLEINHVEEL